MAGMARAHLNGVGVMMSGYQISYLSARPRNAVTMQTEAASLARPRPSRPAFVEDLPPSRDELSWRIHRRIKGLMLKAIDNGWIGLRPLRTHVVVCGFPRSGSTLLQLMIETSVADV